MTIQHEQKPKRTLILTQLRSTEIDQYIRMLVKNECVDFSPHISKNYNFITSWPR